MTTPGPVPVAGNIFDEIMVSPVIQVDSQLDGGPVSRCVRLSHRVAGCNWVHDFATHPSSAVSANWLIRALEEHRVSCTTVTQIPGQLNGVGPGWHLLLMRLHSDVVALDPTYRVAQLKEKFGTLRAYLVYENQRDRITALVTAAEGESAKVCENCGAPGYVRSRADSAWLVCLCDTCIQGPA